MAARRVPGQGHHVGEVIQRAFAIAEGVDVDYTRRHVADEYSGVDPAGVVNWGHASSLPPGAHLAMHTLLMTAIGVGWGISRVTWASDYPRFIPLTVSSKAVFWYGFAGMFVPAVWLAILGATVASLTQDTDPAMMVSAVFGGLTSILVLLMVLHGPIASSLGNPSAVPTATSTGAGSSRSSSRSLRDGRWRTGACPLCKGPSRPSCSGTPI
jgi:hypothetical protein